MHKGINWMVSVFLSYLGDRVHGHQPGDEALVPGDVAQHGRVAVADRNSPGHTGVKVVVHANRQAGRFGCWPGQGDCLSGIAIPGVTDTIWVTDGLDSTLSQLWQLPAGPMTVDRKRQRGWEAFSESGLHIKTYTLLYIRTPTWSLVRCKKLKPGDVFHSLTCQYHHMCCRTPSGCKLGSSQPPRSHYGALVASQLLLRP